MKRFTEIVFNREDGKSLVVHELSSLMASSERSKYLRKFQSNKVDLLICSDAMSRGLDLPNLDVAINFECPFNVESYVHRVGRTARGLGKGMAITMIEKRHYYKLKGMMENVENGDKLERYKLPEQLVQKRQTQMAYFAEELSKVLEGEEKGMLNSQDALVK